MHQLDPARRMLDLQRGLVDVELLLAPAAARAGPRHRGDLQLAPLRAAPRGPPARVGELARVRPDRGGDISRARTRLTEQWGRDAWLSDRRGHDPKVTPETPLTLDEVWALVHAGKAVSVLPRFMVRRRRATACARSRWLTSSRSRSASQGARTDAPTVRPGAAGGRARCRSRARHRRGSRAGKAPGSLQDAGAWPAVAAPRRLRRNPAKSLPKSARMSSRYQRIDDSRDDLTCAPYTGPATTWPSIGSRC